MNSIREAAEEYTRRGCKLVRLRSGEKAPCSSAWQNAEPGPADFRPHDNIGVQLGARSGGLVDVDLDNPWARRLAGELWAFGQTPAFRRQSLPASEAGHRLVVCPDAPNKVERFDFGRQNEKEAVAPLNMEKDVVLEIRAGKGQTAFPPSVLKGDRLIWCDGVQEPPIMQYSELRRRAGLLAFCAFAAECYPSEGGRDNFCLHLAGVLVHSGVNADTAEDIVTTIAVWRDDTENRGGKAHAAALRLQAGEPVAGLPTFLEQIGMAACESRLRSWLGLPSEQRPTRSNSKLPEGAIMLDNPNIVERTAQLEEMLTASGVGIFRKGSELVRVRTLDVPEGSRGDDVWRHKDLSELVKATAKWIAHTASEFGQFYIRRRQGVVRVPPSADVMAELEVAVDRRKFLPVIGLTMTPTLTRNEPGYDAESKLILAFKDGDFPASEMKPTKAQAQTALALLMGPLREFPFADEAARSVAASAMLCGVIRGSLSACPMHLFDAPTAGTGKTKLAEIVGIIATGVPPSGISYSSNMEENEKRLTALLRAGDPVVLLDNVSYDLEGDTLCAALTQDVIQARILGLSETVRLSARALLLATGNNLRVKGDLTRRAVVCRLDAKVSSPEERTFDFDPVQEVRRDRAQLVVDALTVLRAYDAAGRPVKLPAFGSFEEWAFVRGALVWLGMRDPLETKALLKAANPELEDKAELFSALLATFPIGSSFTVKQIAALGEGAGTLRARLAQLLPDNRWDPRKVGRLLLRHRDHPFHGVTLRSQPGSAGAQSYWLDGHPDEVLRAHMEGAPM